MKQVLLPLPIDPYVADIVRDCQDYPTVLIKATPGSGKTTRLPWAIACQLRGKVLVLEPRRLAAKLAAERIADENSFLIGQEVGYHFRMEKQVSSQTRLIFHTEGTFLKKLIADPDLSDVSAVILDEVHERHLDTDLSLAYLRTLQKKRPELKLILMSATLDTSLQQKFLDAKLWEIEAKNFEVEIRYLPNQPSILNQTLEQKVNNALRECDGDTGHVLTFLPGMREMLRVQQVIGEKFGKVYLLHGEISKADQAEALLAGGKRKIILATNIAESSLTIPGVRIVIDSGIQREASYSPWNGLKLLQDKKTTKSSSIQRKGRAGRQENGICLRLYSEQDYQAREEATEPEILRADLTDTYLLGLKLESEFDWLAPPPDAKWEGAKKLAFRMGAVTSEGNLTEIGERMFRYPVDARIARTLVEGENLVLTEKKKLLSYICDEIEDDRSGILSRRLQAFLTEGKQQDSFEKSVLTGFIDQTARFRPKHHDFVHFSGKSFKAHPSLHSLEEGYYIVIDVTQRQEVKKVLSVDESWFYDLTPFPLTEEIEVQFNEDFILSSQVKLGSIVVENQSKVLKWADVSDTNREKVMRLGQKSLDVFWEEFKKGEVFGQIAFWAKSKNLCITDFEKEISFKQYSETFITLKMDQLEAYFTDSLKNALGASSLNNDLPLTLNLGGRNPLPIHYSLSEDPYVEAPIQDFYGQSTSPALMNGKVPLTLKLLGPHKRPIQVTKDLRGFWDKTYKELKKEYQREYPRHHWPDDPATAKPILLKRMLL